MADMKFVCLKFDFAGDGIRIAIFDFRALSHAGQIGL